MLMLKVLKRRFCSTDFYSKESFYGEYTGAKSDKMFVFFDYFLMLCIAKLHAVQIRVYVLDLDSQNDIGKSLKKVPGFV